LCGFFPRKTPKVRKLGVTVELPVSQDSALRDGAVAAA
jgi:hypothetical protein